MKTVKKNNEQLLDLLEKYDKKVTELQVEIDIKDLKMKNVLEENDLEGHSLNDLEDRISFLITLLEKCKQ